MTRKWERKTEIHCIRFASCLQKHSKMYAGVYVTMHLCIQYTHSAAVYLRAERTQWLGQHLHSWRGRPACSPSLPAGGTQPSRCLWTPHTPPPAWTWACRRECTSIQHCSQHVSSYYTVHNDSPTKYNVCKLTTFSLSPSL